MNEAESRSVIVMQYQVLSVELFRLPHVILIILNFLRSLINFILFSRTNINIALDYRSLPFSKTFEEWYVVPSFLFYDHQIYMLHIL